MAGIKISGLPAVASALTTDFFPVVQGGVTSRETLSQVATLFNSTLTFLPLAGGTMSGNINMGGFKATNAADPNAAQDYATKNYVDQTALNGTTVYAASAASLGTVTQSGAGAGATITNAGALAIFELDGVNPPVGSNVLIKNTATGMTSANEGIYTVTDAGGATNWVLTRATSYDTATEINNTGLIVVQNGSTLAGTAWYNAATIVTVDTTAFNYSQFGNIVFPVTLAQGGTGKALTASNGGIVWSDASTMEILSGTATAGLALLSGASATPSWSTSPPITQVVTQVFNTGTSTYTPTTGAKYVFVQQQAAGGSGGGVAGTAAQGASGGGGGGGGYNERLYTIAQIGASATVVVGAAGAAPTAGNNPGNAASDSTFTPAGAGTVLTAGGGGAGAGSASSASAGSTGQASNGGSATGGTVTIPGGNGGYGWWIAAGAIVGWGNGGISHMSTTPRAVVATSGNSADGDPGILYGAGGNGAYATQNVNQAGGAGASGITIVTEYISV